MTAPAWGGCELVRDRNGDLWTISGECGDGAPVYTSASWSCDYSAATMEAQVGPCTPVLGPEGEPVITAADVDEITDVLLDVQWASLADIERAVKRRLYVWDSTCAS